MKTIKLKNKVVNIFPYGDCLCPIIPKVKSNAWKKKQKTIHKRIFLNISHCGRMIRWKEYSIFWSKVTCKNCLRCKR